MRYSKDSTFPFAATLLIAFFTLGNSLFAQRYDPLNGALYHSCPYKLKNIRNYEVREYYGEYGFDNLSISMYQKVNINESGLIEKEEINIPKIRHSYINTYKHKNGRIDSVIYENFEMDLVLLTTYVRTTKEVDGLNRVSQFFSLRDVTLPPVYDNSKRFMYFLDKRNRLSLMTDTSGIIKKYTYNDRDLVIREEKLGSDGKLVHVTDLEYDTNGSLIRKVIKTNPGTTGDQSGSLIAYTYQFDENGNTKQIKLMDIKVSPSGKALNTTYGKIDIYLY